MANVSEPPEGGKAGISSRSPAPRSLFGGSTIKLRDYQEAGMAAIRRGFTNPLSDDAVVYRMTVIERMRARILRKPALAKRLEPEIAYIQKRLKENRTRAVMLVSPTGSGKGTVAAYALTEAARKGNESVFVVHTREIVKDVHERLLANGAPAGIILAGEPEQPDLPIQVCSLQTLLARGRRPPARFIVWDEGHHCVAKSYRAVADAYPHAQHLALTATPCRGDESPLGDVFDQMVELATVKELTKRGFLVPAVITSPDEFTSYNLSAHPVAVYLDKTPGLKAIVFAVSKHEVHALADEFNAAGVPALPIDDAMPKLVREHAIKMFRAGTIRVIVNCNVLTEGFDAPETEVIILAKPYRSPGGMIQAVGRGLRPSPQTGKTYCRILDLCGNWHLHGKPSDDRHFDLFGEPIILTSSDIARCPRCKDAVDAWTIALGGPGCPRCGYVRPDVEEKAPERAPVVETELHDYADMQLSLPFAQGAQIAMAAQ